MQMLVYVRLKNKRTGERITLDAIVWQQKKEQWKHLFEEIRVIQEPDFVTALKERLEKRKASGSRDA